MNLAIRKEQKKDYEHVLKIIERAFHDSPYSDHREQFLVQRLRKSESFISDFSLVAEINSKLVGYILMTPVQIKNEKETYESIALAPVAVLPEYQSKGIGSQLINFAHNIVKNKNFDTVVLIGHETYYPKFGYEIASLHNIKFPFKVPSKNCMILELIKGSLSGVSGTVSYPKEFYEF